MSWAGFVVGTVMASVLFGRSTAAGEVELALIPRVASIPAGEQLSVDLIATAWEKEEPTMVSAVSVLLTWDPMVLGFAGIEPNRVPGFLAAGFLADADGVNETLADGEALFTAFAVPGGGILISPAGLRLATLVFDTLAPAPPTSIDIPSEVGDFARTRVFAAGSANVDLFGRAIGTTVTVLRCQSADADSDEDRDLKDFAEFQSCLTLHVPIRSCVCLFDQGGDSQVGQPDYTEFFHLFRGPEAAP